VSDAAAEDQIGPGPDPDDDTMLINAVRSGDAAAYGVLYERHLVAAKRAASAARHADRDDLVAESFAQVLRMLRAGRGPDEKVRPYLLTTLRNAMTDTYRRNSTQSVVAEVPDTPPPGGENPVETRAHALVATSAFRQLPQRWRWVLWYTEVEGRSPAEVAKLLGLTPNGVAALAYRAREALRQAYLDQYLPTTPSRACRPVVGHLAKWVRHKLTAPTTKRITAHVNRCCGCRRLATDLEQLNQQLPMLLGPLVAGAPLAIASIAGTAGTLVAATGVAEAATTGLSIASWTAAAKTVLAGAAVVATTALGTTSSVPATTPGNTDVATQPTPKEHDITTPRNPLAGMTAEPTHHDQARASDTKPYKRNAQPAKAQKEKKQANKASDKASTKKEKAAKTKKVKVKKVAKAKKKAKSPEPAPTAAIGDE
jgi:RNA polymerase sigma factor (sigma-70 family)